MAANVAAMRRSKGLMITWKGGQYAVSEEIVGMEAVQVIAQGLGINEATADIRVLKANPCDFAGGLFPQEMDTITISQEPAQHVYQIGRAVPKQVAGIAHTWEMAVYRESATPSSTTIDGEPKDYTLPANSIQPS